MRIHLLAVLPIALVAAAPAHASSFSDRLAECLVNKATDQDKTELVQWMFGVLSVSEKVSASAKVTPEQRAAMAIRTGKLFERLLTVDCRAETVAALKVDGVGVVETSFEVLGRVAMRGFMSDPAVSAELGALQKGVDTAKLNALFAEAGYPAKP